MTGKTRNRVAAIGIAFFTLALIGPRGHTARGSELLILASGPAIAPPAGEEKLTPQERMKRRFPQPVRIGDLIGLPVLDESDSTIGFVRAVVRDREGKISLIVPYSAWFGWARTEWKKRPVAVPIETVAILARQLNADMPRSEFDAAPTWMPSDGTVLAPGEKTLIALGRR